MTDHDGDGRPVDDPSADELRSPFDPAFDPPRADDVPDDHPVRVLLSQVADDPSAPPSSVSIASVLAAAQRTSGVDSDADIERVTDIDPATGRPRYVPPVYARPLAVDGPASPAEVPAPPVPTPVWSSSAAAVPASVLAARQVRRRRRLAILAAAACVGVAAVAIPFAVSRGGSGASTASAPGAATSAAAAASAAGGAAQPGRESATTTLGAPGEGGALSGGGGFAATTAPSAAAPSSLTPEDLQSGAASEGPGSGESGGAAGTGSCSWTPLPAPVASALAGVLPGGSYGDPQPLTTGCRPDGAYGASVPSTQNQPALTVTVSRSADAACTTASPACVSAGQGQYIGSTPDGQLTVYAYASGWEAMIAPDAADAGDPTLGAATVEELLQAAQAVADAAAAG